MELYHIEKAVRAQIITTNNPAKRLETDPIYNLGSKGLGKMVFIGIATMHGFTKEQLMDYLDCGGPEIDTKLTKYNEYMEKACGRPGTIKLNPATMRQDMICVVHSKTELARRFIELNYLHQGLNLASIRH